VLSANYVAARLAGHYDIHYSSNVPALKGGGVAHECILDLRPLKDSSGVSAEDVAKRLIDYGFHAPTLSFPVAGTLMVEPTESEPKAELDRFCDAMIAIRAEIAQVEAGTWPADDHPLKHAPHTAAVVSADDWSHAYSRSTAAWPVASLRAGSIGRRWAAWTTSGVTATCSAAACRCRSWPVRRTEHRLNPGMPRPSCRMWHARAGRGTRGAQASPAAAERPDGKRRRPSAGRDRPMDSALFADDCLPDCRPPPRPRTVAHASPAHGAQARAAGSDAVRAPAAAGGLGLA
jgi:hypothetical protein